MSHHNININDLVSAFRQSDPTAQWNEARVRIRVAETMGDISAAQASQLNSTYDQLVSATSGARGSAGVAQARQDLDRFEREISSQTTIGGVGVNGTWGKDGNFTNISELDLLHLLLKPTLLRGQVNARLGEAGYDIAHAVSLINMVRPLLPQAVTATLADLQEKTLTPATPGEDPAYIRLFKEQGLIARNDRNGPTYVQTGVQTLLNAVQSPQALSPSANGAELPEEAWAYDDTVRPFFDKPWAQYDRFVATWRYLDDAGRAIRVPIYGDWWVGDWIDRGSYSRTPEFFNRYPRIAVSRGVSLAGLTQLRPALIRPFGRENQNQPPPPPLPLPQPSPGDVLPPFPVTIGKNIRPAIEAALRILLELGPLTTNALWQEGVRRNQFRVPVGDGSRLITPAELTIPLAQLVNAGYSSLSWDSGSQTWSMRRTAPPGGRPGPTLPPHSAPNKLLDQLLFGNSDTGVCLFFLGDCTITELSPTPLPRDANESRFAFRFDSTSFTFGLRELVERLHPPPNGDAAPQTFRSNERAILVLRFSRNTAIVRMTQPRQDRRRDLFILQELDYQDRIIRRYAVESRLSTALATQGAPEKSTETEAERRNRFLKELGEL